MKLHTFPNLLCH